MDVPRNGAVMRVTALALLSALVLVGCGKAAKHRAGPEARGFQTSYYAREGESALSEQVLTRERALEEQEGGSQSTETKLGAVRCMPQPPAPLPSLTLTCTATVERRALYSQGRPDVRHTWQGTVRLNPSTQAVTVVSLRRNAGPPVARSV